MDYIFVEMQHFIQSLLMTTNSNVYLQARERDPLQGKKRKLLKQRGYCRR